MKSFAEFIDESKSGDSSLRDWFSKSSSDDGTPGWVQLGGKYAGKPCARQPGQTTKPKCGSSKMKRNLSKDEEERAFRRKNRKDPNPDRKGKAKNVATEEFEIEEGMSLKDFKKKRSAQKQKDKRAEEKTSPNRRKDIHTDRYSPERAARHRANVDPDFEGDDERNYPGGKLNPKKVRKAKALGELGESAGEKDACYSKVKSRYKIWPSAYASGALVKCRKKGAANWGNSTKKEGFSQKATALIERYTKIQERGKTYHVRFQWRGKYEGIQLFFPSLTTPTKMEVSAQIEKIYPGATVISFGPHFRDPTQPLLHVGEDNP